jgi:hypothetical protein
VAGHRATGKPIRELVGDAEAARGLGRSGK